MQVPIEALTMNKSERKIIRLFSQLSMKKRNRIVDVLNDMANYDDENEIEVELRLSQKLVEKKEDDGTRGDCDPEPFVTKEQLDRELDEYIQSNPSFPRLHFSPRLSHSEK